MQAACAAAAAQIAKTMGEQTGGLNPQGGAPPAGMPQGPCGPGGIPPHSMAPGALSPHGGPGGMSPHGPGGLSPHGGMMPPHGMGPHPGMNPPGGPQGMAQGGPPQPGLLQPHLGPNGPPFSSSPYTSEHFWR